MKRSSYHSAPWRRLDYVRGVLLASPNKLEESLAQPDPAEPRKLARQNLSEPNGSCDSLRPDYCPG
jgi:hypothetical protein